MNKILNKIILLVISLFIFSNNIFALENSDIVSNEAILYNFSNDEVLFHKDTNANAVAIASLTKLMTYYVITQNVSDIDNTKITISQEMLDSLKDPEATTINLQVGEVYSVKDLLYGMMLASGCDAAYALAYYVGGGNIDTFVGMMNGAATLLGMNKTTFTDPSGLGKYIDASNILLSYSTEEDLYKLSKVLFRSETFKTIISTEFYYLPNQSVPISNTNFMVGSYAGHGYYYKYSQGGKTGTLDQSGRCLLQYAFNGEHTLIAITLGVPDNTDGYYNLYDHEKLFEYGFSVLDEAFIDIDKEIASVNINEQIKLNYATNSKSPITFTSSDESVAVVDANGIVTGIGYGKVTIKAITSNGNYDSILVSVGFYNGTFVNSRTVDNSEYKGDTKLKWNDIEKIGFDYIYIRTAEGIDKDDIAFKTNTDNVIRINLTAGIYFSSSAKTIKEAEDEANYLLEKFLPYISGYKKFTLPILYDLRYTSGEEEDFYYNISLAFANVLKEKGYNVSVLLKKRLIDGSVVERLQDKKIDVMLYYLPYETDFKVKQSLDNKDINMWLYRTDGGYDSLYDTIMQGSEDSLIYMNKYTVDPSYDRYVIDNEEVNTQLTSVTNKVNNPNTLDNIKTWIIILGVTVLVLIAIIVFNIKKKKK